MFKRPGTSSLYLSKIQSKATLFTITISVLGIYFNASFNYANLLMTRSRYAIEQIKYLSDSYVNQDTTYGKSCLLYGGERFSDGEVVQLWDGLTERFEPSGLDISVPAARRNLRTCLSGFKKFASEKDFDQFVLEKNSQQELEQVGFYISRQIFSFLNAHETVFRTWNENKADQEIFCEQMSNGYIKKYLKPFVEKTKTILLKAEKPDLFSIYYPNVNWYVQNQTSCTPGLKRWTRNYVEPLVPFAARWFR